MKWSNRDLATELRTERPVLVLGGKANALEVARSLGRRGAAVYTTFEEAVLASSRFVRKNFRPAEYGNDYSALLESQRNELRGAAVFACSDDAVEFVARSRQHFEDAYLFERNVPALQLAMLDKQKTLDLARSLSIPTPEYWQVNGTADVEALAPNLPYPVIVKPFDTFGFRRHFGVSYLRANSPEELLSTARRVDALGLRFMISELIPGADDCACSVYTYIDDDGQELFSLTKRCLRRTPNNVGAGTFQITEHLEDVRELGRRFFRGIGWRGFGNLEFKRDPRDGSLRVIECNARFTAVHAQLAAAGNDLSLLSYRHMTGQKVAPLVLNKPSVAIWSPPADLGAFRQFRSATGATYSSWLLSLRAQKRIFPLFAWHDPAPVLRETWQGVSQRSKRMGRRFLPSTVLSPS